MQLKKGYLGVIFLSLFLSCSVEHKINDEIKIINEVYNSILISKSILSPPTPEEEEVVEPLKKVDINKQEFIKYAINKKFVNFKIQNVSNKFRVYKSKELFQQTTICDEDYTLIQSLNNKTETFIDVNAFKKINREEVLFVEKQF